MYLWLKKTQAKVGGRTPTFPALRKVVFVCLAVVVFVVLHVFCACILGERMKLKRWVRAERNERKEKKMIKMNLMKILN